MGHPPDRWDWPESLDAMQAAPRHHKVLLENERVRLREAWVAPGDTVPVHPHRRPGVLHAISSSGFVRRDPNGAVLFDSRIAQPPPARATVVWGTALAPHSVTNVGAREVRIMAVEVRR